MFLSRYSIILLFSCSLLTSCNQAPDKQQNKTTVATPLNHVSQSQVLQPANDPFVPDNRDQLEALGYLGGYETAEGASGISIYDPDKTCSGINLVVSGDKAEVYLMKNDGTVKHKWICPRSKAFPKMQRTISDKKARSFRRAYVLPNGDLIGIYNGTGMVRISGTSKILWTQSAMCHHDLSFSFEKNLLYTFIHEKHLFPSINKTEQVMDEYIAVIDMNSGHIIRKISILAAFENSIYAPYLKKIPSSGDLLHANSIHLLGKEEAGVLPIYKTNHLLISLRNMDTIALLDLETDKIHWAQTGMWSVQHEPSILKNGNILLFDNAGHQSRSKVLEFNPTTQGIIWQYADSPETPLFSSTSGSCSRLPNGNTLIVESNAGRALEVTLDKNIVWEFLNPGRWGARKNLRATLFDLQRIPETYFTAEFLSTL